MTRIEDLLRAATRETTAEVTPQSIPPLDVATLPLPRRRPRLRLRGPFAPLLAAAAVALVVVLSLVLSSVLAVPRPPAGAPGLAGVPPYYVALTATGTPAGNHPMVLTVRSTVTGTVLATVTAPHPYGTFNLVQGTADDRTFLVGAQEWHPQITGTGSTANVNNIPPPVQLYWLRFDPSAGHVTLTALPIPPFNGEYLINASVSPDGTRLAVAYEDTWLRIYSLPGGAERSWRFGNQEGYIGYNRDDWASIGWTADDRTISFLWAGGVPRTEYGVNLADVAALMKSSTLLGPSRLALPMYPVGGFDRSDGNFTCDSDPILSANGADILCGGWVVPTGFRAPVTGGFPRGAVTQGFAEFSARTGKLITILGAWRAPLPTARVKDPLLSPGGRSATVTVLNRAALPYLLWASADATTVIGTANGRGIAVGGGLSQVFPWSSRIAVPAGSSVPGAAW